MADKAISELVAAQQITGTDMFVLEQNGTAKKLTGQILLSWLTAAADGHGGIQSIAKLSTSGLADTYRITLADTNVFDFVVTNGRGIRSLKKSGTSGLVDTYTFTYNDGTIGTFTVTNGEKGDKGDNAYIWVKYASQEPTASSNSFGDLPDKWMGVYFGTASTAPTNWQQYKWYQTKGEKGDTGEPARLLSSAVEYQVSDSGTIIPSGTWSAAIPVVSQGRYLWTRITNIFNTGSPVVGYSVSRMGIDGSGSVSSVAGISPNADGDIPLTAENIGALSSKGGSMTGSLNMNGQKITGLNAPTKDDEPTTKNYTETYVKNAVKKAAPYNYANNSDFTQFVAQVGIGGNHGTQAYAGDRWILVSGTVTGQKNANGNGYSNIKLTGEIRQKVANPPAVGTVGIEMVSGAATIVYENGEIAVTSAGGVIKNVALYEGEYTTKDIPKYHPKGYAVELNECMQYYQEYGAGLTLLWDNNRLWSTFLFVSKMRVAPSAVLKRTNIPIYSYGGATEGNLNVSSCVLETVATSESASSAIVIAGTSSQTISKGMYRYNDITSLVAFSADL